MGKVNAVHVNAKDSCVVVTEEIKRGQTVSFFNDKHEVESIVAQQDIPIYHKIAVQDIKKGDFVIKYGEHIGYATQDIRVGDYVHVHNIKPVGELRK